MLTNYLVGSCLLRRCVQQPALAGLYIYMCVCVCVLQRLEVICCTPATVALKGAAEQSRLPRSLSLSLSSHLTNSHPLRETQETRRTIENNSKSMGPARPHVNRKSMSKKHVSCCIDSDRVSLSRSCKAVLDAGLTK